MAYEIAVGLAILAAAVLVAWLLKRLSRNVTRNREVSCPGCGAKMPRDAKTCPHCSREIHVCQTCHAYILDSDGCCEVCGERLVKPAPPLCQCPRCGSRVEGKARKCPACGEEFWSPIVTRK